MPQVSLAAVPLLSGETTTGTLGFIKFGDRDWTPPEVDVLKAIAALLAQVQARIVVEEQLRYSADHDSLTGLSNRRALYHHLDTRLAESEPGPVAILFLDLDRLKPLNDFFGHGAGDGFISTIADRLRSSSEADDLVSRLGGDEFVLVLGGSRRSAGGGGAGATHPRRRDRTGAARPRGRQPQCQHRRRGGKPG